MTAHKPMTPADHIARAKSEALNGDARYATAHALIAIAELIATNMTDVILDATTRGAVATAEAFSSILSAVSPASPPCGATGDSGAVCTLPPGHASRHENRATGTWWTH